MNQVIDYLNNYLETDKKIVIGCSGGPDSMCLLHVLLSLKEQYNLTLICAHVNHNVREESKEEAEFVKKYCEDNDIIFEHMVIEEYDDDNFHNQARNKRYDFFNKLINKYNAYYLMTAHHADDLMETILMRISRGSTLKGYRGFDREVYGSTYITVRPLMNVTKEEIMEYNKNNNIPYRLDYTNDEDHYTRNRYRHNILPFLKNEDPNIHQKYLKFHDTLKEYDEYFTFTISEKIPDIFIHEKIELDNLNKELPIIKKKIVAEVLHYYYQEDLFLVNDTHIDAIISLGESDKANATINLPGDMIARKTYNRLEFIKSTTNEEYEIELNDAILLPNNYLISIVEDCDLTDNYCTRINYSDIELPLIVRTRRDGDKMQIKNMEGTKKIKDIFIDEKVPTSKRDMWPIVVDGRGEIIFLPGLKKSRFDKDKKKKYDIIIKYEKGDKINE